jgi:hypothetical protein
VSAAVGSNLAVVVGLVVGVVVAVVLTARSVVSARTRPASPRPVVLTPRVLLVVFGALAAFGVARWLPLLSWMAP